MNGDIVECPELEIWTPKESSVNEYKESLKSEVKIVPFCFVYNVPCINFEDESIVCHKVCVKFKNQKQYDRIVKTEKYHDLNERVVVWINNNSEELWNIGNVMEHERPANINDEVDLDVTNSFKELS